MRALVPILAKKESDDSFIGQLALQAEEFILLIPVDRSEMNSRFGFAATEMMLANKITGEMEAKLSEKGKKAESYTEWGETVQKTVNMAAIKKCGKIILQKQDNHKFLETLEGISKTKPAETELVVL